MSYRGFLNKIELPNLISVNSVVSVYRIKEETLVTPYVDMHDFWEIVCVKSGSFNVAIDNVPFTLSEGDAVIYPPLSPHTGIGPQHTNIDIISFESDSDMLHNIAGRKLRMSESAMVLISESVDLGLELKRSSRNDEMSEIINDFGSKKSKALVLKKKFELLLTCIYAMYDSFDTISERRGYKRQYGESLTKFMRMNINKSLTLEDMANALLISVSRLKTISNDILGAPPMDYFINLKLDTATRLIREGELNISEISEQLGFSSIHYFSRLFKRRVGMSPTEYAKRQYTN